MASQVEKEMPRYVSHKEVWALEIEAVEFGITLVGPKLIFADKSYEPIDLDPMVMARYTPKPGDYFVVYEDGYQSISPKKAFEKGYTKI
jgi:hypothetical protein